MSYRGEYSIEISIENMVKKNGLHVKQGMKAKAFCGATLVSEAYVKCYNISLISAY